ncbi:MAG: response regulator [Syntrophobacterales bacterium]|nr:MAG: response regulator [Syntrophobacterales bacterium]
MKKKRGVKVLLIEDDLSHAELIKRELKRAGSGSKDVVHATSGERGLEVLKEKPFDLVLLDYSLPAMDGLDVLKTMREMDLDIPVVMITGHGSEKVAAQAMRLGAHDYILKSDLFSPKQAAALLGVTYQTVKNYIYRGRLKTHRTPGGHHRIRREDIMRLGFLEEGPSREEMAESYDRLYQGYMGTLGALTGAMDARDGIDSGHSRRVANLVASLMEIMGISHEEGERIKWAALLHDIGKVLISDHILSKPGKLTDQEYYIIRQHPEMGERIVGGVEFLKEIKLYIRHHHERFDGKGYPDGLLGEEIPLGARVIALVEAFDCITSDCTFQRARSLEEAIDEIEKHAGTQFDPEIVRVFSGEFVSKLRDRVIDPSIKISPSFLEGEKNEGHQYPGSGR